MRPIIAALAAIAFTALPARAVDFPDLFDAWSPDFADNAILTADSASTGRKYIVTDQAVSSKEEAKALAQALFDQFSMDYLTGEAVIKGNPKCIPGKTIEFTDFGKAFSGKYLIIAAQHTYRPEEGYRTTISFARNAKAAAK